MSFSRLVRYKDEHDNVSYGDLLYGTVGEGFLVKRLVGDLSVGFRATDQEEPTIVHNLLAPISDTSIIHCVGLNYRPHAQELGVRIPDYPVIFSKPTSALAGPYQKITVQPDAQAMFDYEGELSVIIARDAKDVTEDEALEYVLGYTVGNDVSARNFQLQNACGGQVGYSKSFDQFAPIGPAIISARLVPDPQDLHYITRVNGEIRQDTHTKNMIWSVSQVIAHLTRGRTLRQGTIIMTGTDAGMGWHRNSFLKNGDVVEVEVDDWENIKRDGIYLRQQNQEH